VTFGDVVRAIVTADRALYPGDEVHLRSRLVECLRQRGIYPARVRSLTDESLTWPAPPPGLRFDIDVAQVILSATKDLDPTGEAGQEVSEDVEPGQPFLTSQIAPACTEWAKAHAYDIGLDPNHRIALHGIHVTYRQAADKQPLPELVIQFTQRREDLEEREFPGVPREARAALRAGTVLVASVDGRIRHIVAKPLPYAAPVGLSQAAQDLHDVGVERLAALLAWNEQVADRDALSAWTVEPAVRRLTFASLHAAGSE
jgi:hypothetical protein